LTLYATAQPATAGYGWGYTILDTAWFAVPVLLGASACVAVVVAVAAPTAAWWQPSADFSASLPTWALPHCAGSESVISRQRGTGGLQL
jgi:hypothetical protein